jgi:hypothetical protein
VGSRWPKRAVLCSAVALVVAVLVPVAGVTAAAPTAKSVPQQLVGGWSRNVTAANWEQYGAPGYSVGPWTILILKSGAVDVFIGSGYPPRCGSCVADFTTRISVAGARLTVAPVPVCSTTKGTYGWKVSGRLLTLKLIADKKCGPREALFTGVWKRN